MILSFIHLRRIRSRRRTTQQRSSAGRLSEQGAASGIMPASRRTPATEQPCIAQLRWGERAHCAAPMGAGALRRSDGRARRTVRARVCAFVRRWGDHMANSSRKERMRPG